MKQLNFTIKTRRLIILGVILLACVAALTGQYQVLAVSSGGANWVAERR